MGFAAKLGEYVLSSNHTHLLTPQHKQTKPPELSASPGLNPEELADTVNQPAHQVVMALRSPLKDHMVNLNRATANNLSKANMALPLDPLRDITVDPVNPVNQVVNKGNTALNLNLGRHTVLLPVFLLDLGSLLKDLTVNNPKVSMGNNLDKDRDNTASNLDKVNMDSTPDKDSMDSNQVTDKDSTVSNLPRVNTVNSQDKVNTVNNPLKVNMANNPRHPVEEVSMLGISLLFSSNVFKM